MRYYFCCSYPLANGSVVEPGNWGRLLRMYNLREPQMLWLPFRESIFEAVRSQQFPSLPSRLDAFFACESEADLKKLMLARPTDIGYEVELTDPSQPFHRGCMNEIEFPTGNMTIRLQDIQERAGRYWDGSNVTTPEIVTLSPARILRRL
jgi:hypothetical protein